MNKNKKALFWLGLFFIYGFVWAWCGNYLKLPPIQFMVWFALGIALLWAIVLSLAKNEAQHA